MAQKFFVTVTKIFRKLSYLIGLLIIFWIFRIMCSQSSVNYQMKELTSLQCVNKAVKLAHNIDDSKTTRKTAKVVWRFLSDVDTTPHTLTSHDFLWPVAFSLEVKMTMKKPRTLKFKTTEDGEFLASFVRIVKLVQQDAATEVFTKKRKIIDEPAANNSSLR